MNSIEATIRNTNTKGEVHALRSKGIVPAIIYGGQEQNQKISVSKKKVMTLIDKENFLSNIITLNIEGNSQNVLPREIKWDTITDEPIHLDFLRIVKGGKIILEIPVKFINNDKSPGLKRGGVLNIVRRKVELKCPAENIPNEIIVDLDDKEINSSLKISSVKLPENVVPTITDRDFVIATVVAPTILVEPEKTEEVAAEGEAVAEGEAGEAVEGATTPGDDKEKTTKSADDKSKAASAEKGKTTKPSDDKTKAASTNKETKKK